MATKKATKAKRFDEETLALAAERRSQHAKIRRYLESLEHGPVATTDTDGLNRRIEEIDTELADAPVVQRLLLTQERLDLEAQVLAASYYEVDPPEALEEDFVDNALEWAERKGISYRALRTAGVPAAVLRKAGFKEQRRSRHG